MQSVSITLQPRMLAIPTWFVILNVFFFFSNEWRNASCVDREQETSAQQSTDSAKNSLLTRCFDNWGCFSIGEPFFSSLRPVSLFPVHPDSLDAQFMLVTRSFPDVFHKVLSGKNATFTQSKFNAKHPIKIIIHGFKGNGHQDWIKDLIRELLTYDDYNVISVDWHDGASESYPQAAANARAVGLVISDFIEYIERRYRVSASDIHIIGLDLGAHAAGYVGERIPYLGRITGLDPASPYFENTDPKVRLDPSDATFVDVIHTEGSPTVPSMHQPVGHVDFYPTPGWRRAGCSLPYGDLHPPRRCGGATAPELFTESINMDCPFYGFACNSYANFSTGVCREGCGSDMATCAPMGFKADEWRRFANRNNQVSMFLETGRHEPYCRYHYLVSVRLSDNEETSERSLNETGVFFMKLTGTKGRSPLLQATPGYTSFVPGETLNFVVSSMNLGRLLRADVIWSSSPGFHPHPYSGDLPVIHINRIRASNLETSYRELFCAKDVSMKPEHMRVFFRGGVC